MKDREQYIRDLCSKVRKIVLDDVAIKAIKAKTLVAGTDFQIGIEAYQEEAKELRSKINDKAPITGIVSHVVALREAVDDLRETVEEAEEYLSAVNVLVFGAVAAAKIKVQCEFKDMSGEAAEDAVLNHL